jgi:Fur family transcriptional regulator, ferric uptake regulator
LRLTPQRRVLLEIIETSETHLDAATLLKLAKEKDTGIDRATVYRTLELLKKLRLVNELDLMHLNGEKHYYEVRTGLDHIHLACFQCGKIEEFGSPLFERLKQEIGRERGFNVNVVRMEVGGRCSNCAGQTK